MNLQILPQAFTVCQISDLSGVDFYAQPSSRGVAVKGSYTK